MKTYCDERGFRVFDLFGLKEGQINIQYFSSTEISPIHTHDWCDILFVIQGLFEVTTYHNGIEQKARLGIGNTIYISNNIPHSFRALTPNSILLYYMSEKYDASKVKTHD